MNENTSQEQLTFNSHTPVSDPISLEPSNGPVRGPGTQRRRGYRGRSIRGLISLRPASLGPDTSNNSITTTSRSTLKPEAPLSNLQRRDGNQRRGRARTASTGFRASNRVVEERQFGSNLSTATESLPQTTKASLLNANAASFQPAEGELPIAGGERSAKPQSHLPKPRRASKSKATDLPTRIHEDINHKQYECPICTSEVLRKSKVWSCRKCWTVFHLDCIKKWSKNSESAPAQDENSNHDSNFRPWRCPGCNLTQDVKPTHYLCWCEKEFDPRPLGGLPPHSCGQTCGKQRILPNDCPHPCDLICHAGPCPPCTHMGPTQRCFCGKSSSTRRCIDTKYDTGWSCGTVCDDLMPCGEHFCPRECHDGLCGSCEKQIDARCYCGRERQSIPCYETDVEQDSEMPQTHEDGTVTIEVWVGTFACKNSCGRTFDCGKHICTMTCHPLDVDVVRCPRSPDVIIYCPCGKTLIDELVNDRRNKCDDPIPHCSKTCSKRLNCGHQCQERCHTDDCPPCLEVITLQCRCGRTQFTSLCHENLHEAPRCSRICHVNLSCGRHECGERCCSGETKAAERKVQRTKSRHAGLAAEEQIEAEHICTRPCGRLLTCGNHYDQSLCHRGACGSCAEAIFHDITCFCGRTVVQPPVPCGTQRPRCQYSCPQFRPCGHPQTQHECHPEEESCPPCPFLVEKPCMCGKKTLKNQRCGSDARCGGICGQRLKCGSHRCQKTCHRPGECEDSNPTCQQCCGKPKRTCQHPCEDACHAPYPCREDNSCPHKIMITCPCQHKKQETRCGASKNSGGNANKALKCDDECTHLERNRKLALALNIDPDTHKDDHIPYSMDTLRFFQDNTTWASDLEREFRVFAADTNEKRLRLKPMPSVFRAFIHSLAEDFGFDSESMDPEPYRHVALFKTPRFVSSPNKALRECVRIRQSQLADEAAANAQKVVKRSVPSEPYNGFLLTNARFALTIDEIQTELAAVQGPRPKLIFAISFLLDGTVALKADPKKAHTKRFTDVTLKELKSSLLRSFNAHSFGGLQLARFTEDLAVIQKETDTASGGGWSQVAAKAAASRPAPVQAPVGQKSSFTVLGSAAMTKNKKKEAEKAQPVLDDWEAEEDRAQTETGV